MKPRLGLQSQLLSFFSLSNGGPKDQFYFYFPYEEDYNDIIFTLPLNGHSAYIVKIFCFLFSSEGTF